MPPLHVIAEPADRKDMLYSGSTAESLCIGHLRGDFGRNGHEFWTSWWPHASHGHNRESFKSELDALINLLRGSLLSSQEGMRAYIRQHPSLPLEHEACGYLAETADHRFYIRCSPVPGDYNFYIYCYLKEAGT